MAAFSQLLTHDKTFDPESLYEPMYLKLCTHIWSRNINFRPPPSHRILWSVLVLTFTLWVNRRRGIDWASDMFFVTDRNVTT